MKHDNVVSPNISSDPFLVDIKETSKANVDTFNQTNDGYAGHGDSTNPFVTSIELTLAAGGAAGHAVHTTSPAPLNPFIAPTKQ